MLDCPFLVARLKIQLFARERFAHEPVININEMADMKKHFVRETLVRLFNTEPTFHLSDVGYDRSGMAASIIPAHNDSGILFCKTFNAIYSCIGARCRRVFGQKSVEQVPKEYSHSCLDCIDLSTNNFCLASQKG